MSNKDAGKQLAKIGHFRFTQKSHNVLSADSTIDYGFEQIERPTNHPLFHSTGKYTHSLTIEGEIPMPKNDDPLKSLYDLAKEKKPRLLTIGNITYGDFIVTSINESKSELNANGTPRMVTFSITLKQVNYL